MNQLIDRLRKLRDDAGIYGIGLERTHPGDVEKPVKERRVICACPVCVAIELDFEEPANQEKQGT